jgi:hypothetical protein
MHAFRESRGPDLSRGLPQFAEPGPEPAGEVSAAAMARYLAQRYLTLPFAVDVGDMAAAWSCEPHGLILDSGDTVSFTVPGSVLITSDGEGESPERQQEVDDYPSGDSMRWSPGDAEL